MSDISRQHFQKRGRGRPPTPPRRRTLFIILSITSSSSSTPYVIQSPSPLSEDVITEHHIQYELGASHPNHPITLYYGYTTSNKYARTPAVPSPTSLDPSDLWDNITIPYSAYFPTGTDSPDHRTPLPDSAEYPSIIQWDQPIQNQELTPEPIPVIMEPVAGPSHHV
ncbi:hypothetical protein ARMGADRAFT_1078489 [Armillaria gallica]|uniref:Uncharacterized protein n=1 Tax=Armillaria gallica TaxID=47427 RepID=A0A2H3DH95_ARMGA|nr:hypothetical protein ARMGADRAFT_1078489 [Armillaria gallica]